MDCRVKPCNDELFVLPMVFPSRPGLTRPSMMRHDGQHQRPLVLFRRPVWEGTAEECLRESVASSHAFTSLPRSRINENPFIKLCQTGNNVFDVGRAAACFS